MDTLVGRGCNPPWKNMLIILDHFCLKAPPRTHLSGNICEREVFESVEDDVKLRKIAIYVLGIMILQSRLSSTISLHNPFTIPYLSPMVGSINSHEYIRNLQQERSNHLAENEWGCSAWALNNLGSCYNATNFSSLPMCFPFMFFLLFSMFVTTSEPTTIYYSYQIAAPEISGIDTKKDGPWKMVFPFMTWLLIDSFFRSQET